MCVAKLKYYNAILTKEEIKASWVKVATNFFFKGTIKKLYIIYDTAIKKVSH